jgi:hypothetical protein
METAHDDSDRLEDDCSLQASKTELIRVRSQLLQKQEQSHVHTTRIISVLWHLHAQATTAELPRISRLPTMTELTHSCSFSGAPAFLLMMEIAKKCCQPLLSALGSECSWLRMISPQGATASLQWSWMMVQVAAWFHAVPETRRQSDNPRRRLVLFSKVDLKQRRRRLCDPSK